MADAPARPVVPAANEETAPFWEGCARDELLLQQCSGCGDYRHPPAPICPRCLSEDAQWVRASGRGTIYTFAIVRQALAKGWEAIVPYVVAVIELEEGPLFVSNMVSIAPEDVAIGMPVEVTFEPIGDTKLPLFRPREV